jgi:hypothetical protein
MPLLVQRDGFQSLDETYRLGKLPPGHQHSMLGESGFQVGLAHGDSSLGKWSPKNTKPGSGCKSSVFEPFSMLQATVAQNLR